MTITLNQILLIFLVVILGSFLMGFIEAWREDRQRQKEMYQQQYYDQTHKPINP